MSVLLSVVLDVLKVESDLLLTDVSWALPQYIFRISM